MNRRDFMKIAGAAIVVPSLPVPSGGVQFTSASEWCLREFNLQPHKIGSIGNITSGELAAKPFLLEDWQKAIMASERECRLFFSLVRRKNGKTLMGAEIVGRENGIWPTDKHWKAIEGME